MKFINAPELLRFTKSWTMIKTDININTLERKIAWDIWGSIMFLFYLVVLRAFPMRQTRNPTWFLFRVFRVITLIPIDRAATQNRSRYFSTSFFLQGTWKLWPSFISWNGYFESICFVLRPAGGTAILLSMIYFFVITKISQKYFSIKVNKKV